MDADIEKAFGEVKVSLAEINLTLTGLKEQFTLQNGRVTTTETWRRQHEQEHAVEVAHDAGVREVQAAFSKRDKAILGLLVAVAGPTVSAGVLYVATQVFGGG